MEFDHCKFSGDAKRFGMYRLSFWRWGVTLDWGMNRWFVRLRHVRKSPKT